MEIWMGEGILGTFSKSLWFRLKTYTNSRVQVAIGALVYGILTVAAYLFIGSTIYGRFLPDLAWQDGTIFP